MQHILLKKPFNLSPRPTTKLTNDNLWDGLVNDPILAVDLETTGLDVFTDDMVLISWASESGVYCVDLRHLTEENISHLWLWLSQKKIFCYNSSFDYAFLKYHLKELAPVLVGDSLIMYKLLANEGYAGQRWNLDTAIKNVLGWPESQKDELHEMIEKHKITAATMYKLADLEPDMFFDYCGADAEAAWQLMHHLRQYALRRGFTSVIEFHDNYYLTLIKLTVEQYLGGLLIDRARLLKFSTAVERLSNYILTKFYTLPEVSEFIKQFNRDDEIIPIQEATEKLVWARKKDEPWSRPDIWTEADLDALGREAKVWEEAQGAAYYRYEAVVRVKNKTVKGQQFNPNSKPHLRALFFDHLKYTSTQETATGLPVIDKKILPKLGQAGHLLATYNYYTKMQGYISRVLEKSEQDSRAHVQLRIHGAVTGRSSGAGGLNIQQMPKIKQFLRCFVTDPGWSLIDTDFTALENVVLAEFSNDAGLREIYASGKPHDSYLWLAYHIFPEIQQELDDVYNMENPTVESVAKAKKQFKHPYRTVSKTVFLASNYNAGARKIHQTITESGLKYTLDEIYEKKKLYNQTFAQVKQFERDLLEERSRRGGWILNGVGRPLCIPDDYCKDIVNRFCQSTGVDLLHMLLYYIDQKRTQQGLRTVMVPWIDDWHDQTTWKVRHQYVDKAKEIFANGYKWLNNKLKPDIPLSGDIDVGTNLWEFKQ